MEVDMETGKGIQTLKGDSQQFSRIASHHELVALFCWQCRCFPRAMCYDLLIDGEQHV